MLINCPKCGRPISDKADTCLHCKTEITKQSNRAVKNDSVKDYVRFTRKERKALLKEFKNKCPEKAKPLKKEDCLETIRIVGILLCSAVMVASLIIMNLDNVNNREVIIGVLLGLFCVCFVGVIVAIFLKKLLLSKILISLKYMELWVKSKNIVNFSFTFSSGEIARKYSEIEIEE